MSPLAQMLMAQDEETLSRPRQWLAQQSQNRGQPVGSPLQGASNMAQDFMGMMMKNPKMFQGLFGLGGASAISPASAMTAYGNMPASYTRPGMGGI
jgi:hypothetical protein